MLRNLITHLLVAVIAASATSLCLSKKDPETNLDPVSKATASPLTTTPHSDLTEREGGDGERENGKIASIPFAPSPRNKSSDAARAEDRVSDLQQKLASTEEAYILALEQNSALRDTLEWMVEHQSAETSLGEIFTTGAGNELSTDARRMSLTALALLEKQTGIKASSADIDLIIAAACAAESAHDKLRFIAIADSPSPDDIKRSEMLRTVAREFDEVISRMLERTTPRFGSSFMDSLLAAWNPPGVSVVAAS